MKLAAALLLLMTASASSATTCVDIAAPKAQIEAHGGRWIELTPDQWQFARGIYAMDPETGTGLPVGDKAAVGELPLLGAIIWFIDDGRACVPMIIPSEMFHLIIAVGAGEITHRPSQ